MLLGLLLTGFIRISHLANCLRDARPVSLQRVAGGHERGRHIFAERVQPQPEASHATHIQKPEDLHLTVDYRGRRAG